ncbi:hypothetical protein [Streptomyces griseosporeus]|uniref:hypothetical protein n=1 Tax=Streptomyces griseosporeus TaxID=1910 RepID=UPI0036FB9179
MVQDPQRVSDDSTASDGTSDNPWSGVLFIGGLLVLYTPAAALCGLIAFFVRGWPTGCLLLGVAAASAALSLTTGKVAVRATRPPDASGDTGTGRGAARPGTRRALEQDLDEASPWVVVSALLFLLGCLGLLALLAAPVLFLIGGWDTGFTSLGAGLAALVAGFAPDGWLRRKRKAPATPSRRAREAAAAAGLGGHVRTLRGPNPLFWLLMVPVAVAAPLALSGGITWLVGDAPEGKAAGMVFLVCLALVVSGPALAVVLLLRMPYRLVRNHLYAEGVVHVVNGRVRVLRWPDITSVDGEFGRRPPHELRGCVLVCADGSRLRVRADRGPVGDPSRFTVFMWRLVPAADRRRIPVHPRLLTLFR